MSIRFNKSNLLAHLQAEKEKLITQWSFDTETGTVQLQDSSQEKNHCLWILHAA